MFKYYLGRVEFTISFFITDAVLAATLKDLFEDGIIDGNLTMKFRPR